MNNVVIVGGGTAGWITALYVNKVFPNKNITLIESSEIGILGAGEGATPHLISFLDFVGIPISDLVKNCDATIKNGIKFTNWKNDKSFYYHSFYPNDDLSFAGFSTDRRACKTHPLVLTAMYLNKKINDIDFGLKVSEKNLVPYFKGNINPFLPDPILKYNRLGLISLHFNALKLANRLKEISISRGIKHIEGIVENFTLDENNNISKIILKDGKEINADFIFDCSGFSRLIIGKKFNSNWKKHSEYLPVDSALPFFIPITDEIPPYTESIAMKYGWMWKIPLQSRFGCGYVYDSSLITEEEAAKEIEEFLGFEPDYPRKNKGSFKFNAGYFEEPWINNCIAIGLSAGFIEPLEATSIWTTLLSLEYVLANVEYLELNKKYHRDDFNLYFKKINDDVVNFIYFHYMSNRTDTEFWKKFTYDNAPKSLKNKLDAWEFRFPSTNDLSELWSDYNWICVSDGLSRLNKNIASLINQKSELQKQSRKHFDNFLHRQSLAISESVSHKEFLESLK
jgi:tryptophan halogenase